MDKGNQIEKYELTSERNVQLDVVNNLQNSIEVLGHLAKSGVIPAKNAEQAMVYYLKAKELNIPFVTNMGHMHIINGVIGIGVHLLKALILRSKLVTWKKTIDYKPAYEYTDGTLIQYLLVGAIPDYYAVIPIGLLPEADCKEITIKARKEGKTPIWRTKSPLIYITEYEFKRKIKSPIDNSIETLTVVSRFTTQDQIAASLGFNQQGEFDLKSAWAKYPSTMLDNRAWAGGARAIADDIINGLYTLDELYDMNDVKYQIINDVVVAEEDKNSGTM